MTQKERAFIAVILLAVLALVGTDLITDSSQGVQGWHLAAEASIAGFALAGLAYLLRGAFTLRHSLEEQKQAATQLAAEAEKWRAQSRKYLEGLSHSIDAQLSSWKLTGSEKEVAFLLLKGLSSKEIAEIRKTSEKTVRAQAVAIYSKAGLGGRSELLAFFLEDLYLPATPLAER